MTGKSRYRRVLGSPFDVSGTLPSCLLCHVGLALRPLRFSTLFRKNYDRRLLIRELHNHCTGGTAGIASGNPCRSNVPSVHECPATSVRRTLCTPAQPRHPLRWCFGISRAAVSCPGLRRKPTLPAKSRLGSDRATIELFGPSTFAGDFPHATGRKALPRNGRVARREDDQTTKVSIVPHATPFALTRRENAPCSKFRPLRSAAF